MRNCTTTLSHLALATCAIFLAVPAFATPAMKRCDGEFTRDAPVLWKCNITATEGLTFNGNEPIGGTACLELNSESNNSFGLLTFYTSYPEVVTLANGAEEYLSYYGSGRLSVERDDATQFEAKENAVLISTMDTADVVVSLEKASGEMTIKRRWKEPGSFFAGDWETFTLTCNKFIQ